MERHADTDEQEPLTLGHLRGAVLTYEDGDGNTVTVQFDE